MVTILIGLPGSGKTTFLTDASTGRLRDNCFDDFHGGSLDGTPAFLKSKDYEELKQKLWENQECVISDIEYCRSERLKSAQARRKALLGALKLHSRKFRKAEVQPRADQICNRGFNL
jgi:hypothetical protein